MKSKLMRIDTELADEIRHLASKNNMKQVEVTREVAKMLKMQKIKLSREIIF